jgi:ABC-type polysaccharide/polyol phosphate export permease
VSVAAISWIPLFLIIVVANLFFGTFALWVTTFIKDFDHLGSLWTRFIFPIWFLGGFQFPWSTMHELVPTLAYITLLDPVVYTMEGTRSAMLGGATYFNAWLCIAVLSLFCVLCFADGMRRLKKRLDFV